MGIENIRVCNRIPRGNEMKMIIDELYRRLKQRGYNNYTFKVTKTRIDITNVRLSDEYVNKFGMNKTTIYGRGNRRGRILGWINWVLVNEVINAVLNEYNVSAKVTSQNGMIRIREGTNGFNEYEIETMLRDRSPYGAVDNLMYRWTPENDDICIDDIRGGVE